jgi:hypothetical protein
MSPYHSCCTCDAEVPEHELYQVMTRLPRLNGQPLPAEIEVCEDCVLEIDCEILLDPQDRFGGLHIPRIRERVTM